MEDTFVESEYVFELDGKKFYSGGAFLLPESKTGKIGGIVRVKEAA